jgi:hypothetical protein
MGKWGDGKMGKWEDEKNETICLVLCLVQE